MDIEPLNTFCLQVFSRWISEVGDEESGALNFYKQKLQNKDIFSSYERELTGYLLKNFDRGTKFFEPGCGYGQLCILLSSLGYDCVGYEFDRKRHAGAEVLKAAMNEEQKEGLGNLEFVNGPYPESFSPDSLSSESRNVLLLSNLVSTFSETCLDAIINSFRHFDHVVLDAGRLGVARDAESQQVLIERVRKAGFKRTRSVFQSGQSVAYHVDNNEIDASEPPPDQLTTAEDVNRFFTMLLQSCLDESTPDHLGMGETQVAKVRQKQFLLPYDLRLAEWISGHIDKRTTILQLNCGYGELCLLLAVRGYNVIGYESYRKRLTVAENMLQAASDIDPRLATSVTLKHGDPLPAVVRNDLKSQNPAALLLSNAVCSYIQGFKTDVTQLFAGAHHVLLDPGHFGISRDSLEEKKLLKEIARQVPLECAEALFHVSGRNAFHLVPKRRPTDKTASTNKSATTGKARPEFHKVAPASSVDDLADLLKQRNITKVLYFHTDHFEPWSAAPDEKLVSLMKQFAYGQSEFDYARKISLFYYPHLPYKLVDKVYHIHVPGDGVAFRDVLPAEARIQQEAMRYILDNTGNEVHLHLHHEKFTSGSKNVARGVVGEWITKNNTPDLDARRFELQLKLALQALERETGSKMTDWSFVHGCWALNASDLDICKNTNEIEVLMRHGCVADFSFPAGRAHCNPKIDAPLTCRPSNNPKCYDSEASEPREITLGGNAFDEGRFLIWNSQIKHPYCSLDYYTPRGQKVLSDTHDIVGRWLRDSFSLGSDLFIKTQAHSMRKEYQEGVLPVFPYRYEPIQKIFMLLERAISRAGAEFQMLTVREVIQRMQKLSNPSAHGGAEEHQRESLASC